MPPSKRRNADTPGQRLAELGLRAKETSDKQCSKRKARKLAAGTIAVEDGKTYDMSLWRAIYATVWRQWWWAVTLNGIGSESGQPTHANFRRSEAHIAPCHSVNY